MTTSPADAYILTALRNAGVPNLWAEDALQDVRIALWRQAERDPKMVIRSAAVDAARRYGPHTRHGLDRTTVSLEALYEARPNFDAPAPVPVVPDYEAIRRRTRAVLILTADERDLLLRFLRPHARFSDRDHGALQRLRKQLKSGLTPPSEPHRYRRVCRCGVTFWSNDSRQRSCEPSCRELHDARRWHAMRLVRGQCEYCREALVYAQWMAKPSTKRFCNRNCAQKARRGRSLEDLDRTCVGCGEPFTAKTLKRVYCSHTCYVRNWYRRRRCA